MNFPVLKLSPPAVELIEQPAAGGLTALSSGTAVLDTRQWLHQLESAGITPRDLREVAEALEEQELEDMVSAWPDDTGLTNAIKIIPGDPSYGPRIKVALNPPDRFKDGGEWAWVPFGEKPNSFEQPRPNRVGGPVPTGKLLRDLQELIERNRAELFAFDRDPDQGGISGAQLVKGLRKVGSAR